MKSFRRLLVPSVVIGAALLVAACSGASTGAGDVVPTPSGPLPPETAPVASAPSSPTPAPTPVPTPDRPGFGQPVGQVQCDYGGHDGSYHVHALLRIVIDGTETDPDNDIGVDQTRCMYWVHTHDATGGVIHVEAPETVTVTLGDFMDVWAVSYPSSATFQAAMRALDAGTLMVDGKIPFGEWRSVPLKDGTTVVVG